MIRGGVSVSLVVWWPGRGSRRGRTVALDSEERARSSRIKFAVALWTATWPKAGLAWDTRNNNRASIPDIQRPTTAASIYIEARRRSRKRPY